MKTDESISEGAAATLDSNPTAEKPELRVLQGGNGEWEGLNAPKTAKPSATERCKKLDSKDVIKFVNDHYVFCEKFAQALARALRTGKNVLFYGPTGHAKSALVRDVIEHLGLKDDTFIQDFGEGTDEASLWGGYNFKRMKEEHILDYHPDRSFLNHEIAVFEELFDAPPQVLCSLKNTLTAKVLQKGADPYPSKNHMIIALTNKTPDEIANMGESYKALVDRFPLRLKVQWPDYSDRAYAQMFDVLKLGDRQMRAEFAKLIAESAKTGLPISPRTAVQAFQIVLNAADEFGGLDARALSQLEFVPGLEEVGKTKAAEWEEKIREATFRKNIQDWNDLLGNARTLLDHSNKVTDLLDSAASLQELEELLINLVAPPKFKDEISKTQTAITDVVQLLTQRAMDINRIVKDSKK